MLRVNHVFPHTFIHLLVGGVISFQGTASRTSLFGPGLPISDTSRSRPQTFYLQQCQIQLVSARVVQYMMLCLEELAYEIADVRTSQAMQNEMTDFQVMLPMLLHLSVWPFVTNYSIYPLQGMVFVTSRVTPITEQAPQLNNGLLLSTWSTWNRSNMAQKHFMHKKQIDLAAMTQQN